LAVLDNPAPALNRKTEPEVPARKHESISYHYDYVVAEARVDAADFAVAAFDQKPMTHSSSTLMDLALDVASLEGEQISAKVDRHHSQRIANRAAITSPVRGLLWWTSSRSSATSSGGWIRRIAVPSV
jgi:hypothetical protein